MPRCGNSTGIAASRRAILPSLMLLASLAAFAVGSTCDSSSTSRSFYCPSRAEQCSAVSDAFVSDCSNDCPGHSHEDGVNGVCVDRRLFQEQTTTVKFEDGQQAQVTSSFIWRDVVGLIIWSITAGIATACGVGGGGIYVPLGILLLNLQAKTSSGLSQASIFGASLGGLLINCRNRHPSTVEYKGVSGRVYKYSRPLVDFDMVVFLAPMQMAGAVLGVLIQTVLPNWLYLLLAAVILAVTAYKTFTKYLASRNKEKEQLAEALAHAEDEQLKDEKERLDENSGIDSIYQPPINEDEDNAKKRPNDARIANEKGYASSENISCNEESPVANGDVVVESCDVGSSSDGRKDEAAAMVSNASTDLILNVEDAFTNSGGNGAESKGDASLSRPPSPDAETEADCIKLLEQDARQYPREKIVALLILWIGLALITFFKGGKGVNSLLGITCMSPWYWVLVAVQFAWTLGFSTLFGRKLIMRQAQKAVVGYPSLPNDVIWDVACLRFYAAFTFLAGIVAGLIGVGGGMFLGPLMLVMGIHPRVSSATNATMIVLTSSSVAVLFVTSGLVPWDYALAFFVMCLIGAYVGLGRIDGYVSRTGRASFLIFLLAVIIALATIGCLVILFVQLKQASWCFAGFHKFCTVDNDDRDAITCSTDRVLIGFFTEE